VISSVEIQSNSRVLLGIIIDTSSVRVGEERLEGGGRRSHQGEERRILNLESNGDLCEMNLE